MSLLSSLFSCSLPSALGLEMKPPEGQYGVEKGWPPSSALSSVLTLLSSPFYLLSYLYLFSLLLHSHIAVPANHFYHCIRPSNQLPTDTTLCGTIPGLAECAKRVNK